MLLFLQSKEGILSNNHHVQTQGNEYHWDCDEYYDHTSYHIPAQGVRNEQRSPNQYHDETGDSTLTLYFW